jgi:minor extracellular serine protease Vpr
VGGWRGIDLMRGTRKFGPAVLVAAMVLAFAGPASAGSSGPIDHGPPPEERDGVDLTGADVADDLWFVEFETSPRARGGAPAAQANERAQLDAQARSQGVDIETQRDFGQLWNGLSVEASSSAADQIRGFDGVRAVYPVAIVDAPEPQEAGPAMASALEMTGANAAQSELGATGEDVSIAIIDTGIDYTHPDLGGDGEPATILADEETREMDHPRISHGWDYVGDEFNPADPAAPQVPAPGPDPIDVEGHGTHVAGIAAASAADDDGVTGVAPAATLGAYKVFGPGSTTADVIVEALEDAYADGFDVINMSLGAAFVWGQDYPTTRVSNELANEGVVVVNSAGNSGADGAWTLSAPANAHDVISVASVENLEFAADYFDVLVDGDEEQPVAYMTMPAAPAPPEEGESAPLELVGNHPVADDDDSGDDSRLGCEPGDYDGFSAGNVAVVERGVCTFASKYDNAVAAGASGIVIYNNAPGLFAGGGIVAQEPWAAAVSQADGLLLVGLLQADETVTLSFAEGEILVPNPSAGVLSTFSSWGQDVELEFGPSVAAPGGMIESTYPLTLGGYATISGTSMAAPHVAGAAALLLEAEDLDPFEVRDRLQNTATPLPWNVDRDFLEFSFRQGAGMIQIDDALTASQTVVPGQLALADDTTVTTTLSVLNDGDEAVTYEVGHAPTRSTAVVTYTVPSLFAPATVDVPETVTVDPGATAEVPVTITAPGVGYPNSQYGGYVTLDPVEGPEDATSLVVPYAGYDGDYADEMGLLGFWNLSADGEAVFVEVDPVLSELVLDEDGAVDGIQPVEGDRTFTLSEGDYPVIDAFFGHFPRTMEVHAVNVRSGQRVLAFEEEYLRRSPWVGETYAFAWDGTTRAGASENRRPVPSGTYTLEVSVLRALGDEGNEDHWDTWTSPEFEIDSRRSGAPADAGPPAGRGPGR